jgi:hypothetical protein
MEYRIISCKDPMELVEKVNELIKEDWIPQGGLCVDGSSFYQAMVKII